MEGQTDLPAITGGPKNKYKLVHFIWRIVKIIKLAFKIL